MRALARCRARRTARQNRPAARSRHVCHEHRTRARPRCRRRSGCGAVRRSLAMSAACRAGSEAPAYDVLKQVFLREPPSRVLLECALYQRRPLWSACRLRGSTINTADRPGLHRGSSRVRPCDRRCTGDGFDCPPARSPRRAACGGRGTGDRVGRARSMVRTNPRATSLAMNSRLF